MSAPPVSPPDQAQASSVPPAGPARLSPKPGVSVGLVVAGYVAALFLPLLGVILGLTAVRKHAGTGINHGPWIIVASVLSFAVGLMMIAGSSA